MKLQLMTKIQIDLSLTKHLVLISQNSSSVKESEDTGIMKHYCLCASTMTDHKIINILT